MPVVRFVLGLFQDIKILENEELKTPCRGANRTDAQDGCLVNDTYKNSDLIGDLSLSRSKPISIKSLFL